MVVTDTGGCGELAKSGGGVVIPLTSPAEVVTELYRALLRFASDEEARLRTSQMARRAVREAWSWEAVGTRLERIYRQATEPRWEEAAPAAWTAAASKS